MSLALPFLDAMVPAGTALAQTAAVPKLRTGFFYIPHGAIMGNTSHGPSLDRWTPSGSGASFTLSPILASLEPYKKYVSSFVGMAPMSDPRIIVAVMIDEPSSGKYYGGQIAGPVFSRIAGDALQTLGVEPDAPFETMISPLVALRKEGV